MKNWTDSAACRSRQHCRACLSDPAFRASASRAFGSVPDRCPFGVTYGSLPMRGLGDAVARVTMAVGIKPCAGCKGRQETLNRLVPFGGGG